MSSRRARPVPHGENPEFDESVSPMSRTFIKNSWISIYAWTPTESEIRGGCIFFLLEIVLSILGIGKDIGDFIGDFIGEQEEKEGKKKSN